MNYETPESQVYKDPWRFAFVFLIRNLTFTSCSTVHTCLDSDDGGQVKIWGLHLGVTHHISNGDLFVR